MIRVEERLFEAFDTLPVVGAVPGEYAGNKPTFRWGNQIHLDKFLLANREKAIYPLIYQISNSSTQSNNENRADVDLSLILALREEDTSKLNEERWAQSYRDYLFPLVENIVKLFSKSQIFHWNGEYKTYTHPNYGNGKEGFSNHIVDALRLDTKITINNNCFKPITF